MLGRIKVGEKVDILGRSSGWAQVASPQIKGWVVETGLGAEPPAAVSVAPLREQLSSLRTFISAGAPLPLGSSRFSGVFSAGAAGGLNGTTFGRACSCAALAKSDWLKPVAMTVLT